MSRCIYVLEREAQLACAEFPDADVDRWCTPCVIDAASWLVVEAQWHETKTAEWLAAELGRFSSIERALATVRGYIPVAYQALREIDDKIRWAELGLDWDPGAVAARLAETLTDAANAQATRVRR